MYRNVIRPLLFWFDPERVHHFTFSFLRFAMSIPGVLKLVTRIYTVKDPSLERNLFGIRFPNPVGLAAGFDKDASLVDEFSAFGFGFIEIGTLTPEPQPGNEKPRLFRLPADQAIINRMGFNNSGAAAAAQRLTKVKHRVIVGGNIGKNKWTPNEAALSDYEKCIAQLHDKVDYFAVNVSSPNTPGLRELQEKEPLRRLLEGVRKATQQYPSPRPVLLKIAPDLEFGQIDDIVEILKSTGIDGVIATNTTISREGLSTNPIAIQRIGSGGLSGKPLSDRSTEVISYLRSKLGPVYPIIGVGGIMGPDDAVDKIKAGASLVQVYTGFVYHGPSIAHDICRRLISMQHNRG